MACAAAAVLSARFFDSDGDGFTNHTEVADTLNYSNTPTFPGLSMASTNLVLDLTAAQLVELAGYLTPVVGGDTTLPVVTVITPTGGQTLVANRATNVAWTRHRCQPDHVHQPVPLHHQRGQLADGRRGGSNHSWVPAGWPTTQARLRVVATDLYGNGGSNQSASFFTIVSPLFTNLHGVASTLRDFDMPGAHPFEHGPDLDSSANCASCHGGFDANRSLTSTGGAA